MCSDPHSSIQMRDWQNPVQSTLDILESIEDELAQGKKYDAATRAQATYSELHQLLEQAIGFADAEEAAAKDKDYQRAEDCTKQLQDTLLKIRSGDMKKKVKDILKLSEDGEDIECDLWSQLSDDPEEQVQADAVDQERDLRRELHPTGYRFRERT